MSCPVADCSCKIKPWSYDFDYRDEWPDQPVTHDKNCECDRCLPKMLTFSNDLTTSHPPPRKPWYTEGYTKRQNVEATSCAQAAGCDIINGDEHTLCLDLDTPERPSLEARIEKLNIMMPHLGVNKAYFLWKSWSGNHHAKVTCAASLTIHERLILEVFLGSDPDRAAYGLARIRDKEDPEQISKLFRPKGAKVEFINGDQFMDTPLRGDVAF